MRRLDPKDNFDGNHVSCQLAKHIDDVLSVLLAPIEYPEEEWDSESEDKAQQGTETIDQIQSCFQSHDLFTLLSLGLKRTHHMLIERVGQLIA